MEHLASNLAITLFHKLYFCNKTSSMTTKAAFSLLAGSNIYEEDPILKPILKHLWEDYNDHEQELIDFGRWAGEELLPALWHLDNYAPPQHLYFTPLGERVDQIWISPLQRNLMDRLNEFGINSDPHSSETLMYHYALGYLLSDAGLYCIFTLTNQVAIILSKYGPFKEEVPYISGAQKPYKYGATFYTEVTSGSDLSQNQTIARRDGSRWLLTGEKYFTSNVGIADYALVTAFEEGAERHIKNLRLFVVPRYRKDGSPNYVIRRLKPKVGSRLVPTGEVELNNSEAYPVGDLSLGIYYTVESLMYARLSNAVASMGLAMKAYLEAKKFAERRITFGKPIIKHTLLAAEFEEYLEKLKRGILIGFLAVAEMDKCWQEKPPYNEQYLFARLLTHIAKNRTAELAIDITQWAIEVFGGIGVLSEFIIERWHREAQVAIIWEGTAHIHALEMVETIRKKGAGRLLIERIKGLASPSDLKKAEQIIQFIETGSIEEVVRKSRHLLRELAVVIENAYLSQIS